MVSHLNSSIHAIYHLDFPSWFYYHSFSPLVYSLRYGYLHDGDGLEIQNFNTIPLRPPSKETYSPPTISKSSTYSSFPSIHVLFSSSVPAFNLSFPHSAFLTPNSIYPTQSSRSPPPPGMDTLPPRLVQHLVLPPNLPHHSPPSLLPSQRH